MSSRSTSVISTEHQFCNSDTQTEFECSGYSRSPSSSRGNSRSGVYTRWFSGQTNLNSPHHQNEQSCIKDFEISKGKVTKVADISDKGWDKSPDNSLRLTVLGSGTRLMRDILFPTVIIQMPKKWLHTLMVYYIILEPASEAYVGSIPCLLFASPKGTKKNIQTAELLPLTMGTSGSSFTASPLTPLLLDERNRCIFRKGCKFKVKAFESGRRIHKRERQWEHYDLCR